MKDRKLSEARRLLEDYARTCPDVKISLWLESLRDRLGGRVTLSREGLAELCDYLQEFPAVYAQGAPGELDAYLRTLGRLIESGGGRGAQRQRGRIMGVLEKVGRLFSRKPAGPASEQELLRRQEEVSESKIEELKSRQKALAGRHALLMKELRALAASCAEAEPGSMDYTILRQEAGLVRSKLESVERQLRTNASVLESSSRYRELMHEGRMNLEMEQLQADTAEAEVLLSSITERAQEMAAISRDFASALDRAEGELAGADPAKRSVTDPEFEAMVAAAQRERKAQTESAAAQKDRAERETQTESAVTQTVKAETAGLREERTEVSLTASGEREASGAAAFPEKNVAEDV